jgi:hypothetical protein
VSQQEFSYFDPEQETVYRPRDINRDPRELYERQEEQEQTFYYVTPERSMLRGEKLIPMRKTKSYAHWVATAVFLLMILIGGLMWGAEVRAERYGYPPYAPGKTVPHKMYDGHHSKWDSERHSKGDDDDLPSWDQGQSIPPDR